METPEKAKTSESCTGIVLGLKALTICNENDHKHQNSCVMTSNLMSPPSRANSTSFSNIGDYIGMESCVDLIDDNEIQILSNEIEVSPSKPDHHHHHNQSKNVKREIPPPITLLARTENLHSHMPFVLRRYYTSDGRLILREEKVKHHEYFKAHRSNGNLTLQLVPLDDDESEVEEEEDADDDNDYIENVEENCDGLELESESERLGGGGNMCLSFNNVLMSPSSCFLGLPVPAVKTVHS